MVKERRLCLTVPPEQDGFTVRRLLKTRLDMAEGFLASLKTCPDGVLLNGEPARMTAPVKGGDLLSVRIDDRTGGNPAEPFVMPLHFLYEDEDLAVLDKPAGLLVHGAPGGAPTLENALAAHWGPDQPFHPVHRLDRGTTGLLVVGKSAYIAERLRRSLHTEAFVREYLALVSGVPFPAEGEISLPLGPEEGERCRRCVRADGREARTAYRVLKAREDFSLLRLRLYTGRSHQIRAHMAALGHPLLGDLLYGGPHVAGLERPALHAAFLVLLHPVTGERLSLSAALPSDLEALLSRPEAN